ncbi:MAG: hypothetical protein CM15mV18_1250 [uncultured marine virus]|nr:MAG: hypothetical protein CM15mV18_1250 [uncultured marine virus]
MKTPYDGSFTTRRAVNYTLGFTAKTYLYGPVYAAKVIKETTADIFTDTASDQQEKKELLLYLIQQRLTQMMILIYYNYN